MKINERLRELRKVKRLTQEQISERIGINRSTYAKYETGDNQPDLETLARIAMILGSTTDYIITGQGYQTVDEREQAARELPGWDNDGEIIEFVEWVKENVEETFFFDFKNTPEGRKEMFKQFMADQRKIWEMERKGK